MFQKKLLKISKLMYPSKNMHSTPWLLNCFYESVFDPHFVKILPNEAEHALALLIAPLCCKISSKKHVHTLENKLFVTTLDRNDALIAEEVCVEALNQV